MIVRDDLVAHETRQAAQCITDDGGADVTHVHRLCHIRGREIDDQGLRLSCHRHPQAIIRQHAFRTLGIVARLDAEIDETRTRNLGSRHGGFAQGLHHLAGQLTRVLAGLLGQHHGCVALVVPEAQVLGRRDTRCKILR